MEANKQQLFPHDVMRVLRTNGIATRRAQNLGLSEPDHRPVVKIFNPFGPSRWLITEVDQDNDTMFGLCDHGNGFPEIGYVSRTELEHARLCPVVETTSITGETIVGKAKDGVPLERDEDWTTEYPLTVWLEAAQREGHIVEDERSLAQAAAKLEREPQRRQEDQHAT